VRNEKPEGDPMKTRLLRLVGRYLATLLYGTLPTFLLCPQAHGQCLECRTNIVIDGVSTNINNILWGLWIGRQTPFECWVITNAAKVTSLAGFIGFFGGGSACVSVTGTGSIWRLQGADLPASSQLFVGYTGGYNKLTITDGGRVENADGII
jgi:T5SS/PEP-CTERM-associated repeat protein